VVVGLGLVGSAARPEPPPALSGLLRLALLGGVPLLAAGGMVAGRRLRPGLAPAAAVLGGLAGLAFALFGVAGRVLPGSGVGFDLLRQPLAWAALAYAGLGLLLY